MSIHREQPVQGHITRPEPASGQVLLGLAWSLAGLLVFSGWFAVTRLVVTGDLGVWDVVALRFAGGALVLSPILLTQCRGLAWPAWQEGFLLSMLWGAPFVLLVGTGLRLTSAADASSVTPGLMPVFAGAIAWGLLRQRPTVRRLWGFGVIILGVAGLIAMGGRGTASPVGFLCLMFAAGTWALYTLRLGASGLNALQAAAMVCFWSAVLYLPPYLLSGISRLPDASLRELVFQGFYQGALMSGLAIYAFNRAVALLGPIAAATITALIPVMATLIAVLLLGEVPPMPGWLAIAAIAGGVLLAASPARASRRAVLVNPTPALAGRNGDNLL
jgi:drug/metabolite transporter (DMT)-like permease